MIKQLRSNLHYIVLVVLIVLLWYHDYRELRSVAKEVARQRVVINKLQQDVTDISRYVVEQHKIK